jgi:hypothetical protein
MAVALSNLLENTAHENSYKKCLIVPIPINLKGQSVCGFFYFIFSCFSCVSWIIFITRYKENS